MGKKYDILSIQEFGAHLLNDEDLDPVYLALTRTGLPLDWTLRFLLAYWCSYHVGFSCFVADHKDLEYWGIMRAWAVNDTESPVGGRWPRGHERRHARGKSGITMVERLEEQFPAPELATLEMSQFGHPESGIVIPCREIMKTVKQFYLFGDWIAFKVADMAYNVLGVKIDFDEAAVFMFKDPRKGAKLFWRQEMVRLGQCPSELMDTLEPKNEMVMINEVVSYLINEFKDHKAPPLRDRPVGVLEVETILCKYKSHLSGHYPLFNDIDEIQAGLVQWQDASESVQCVLDAMPGQQRRK